jgi:hypothetical protein
LARWIKSEPVPQPTSRMTFLVRFAAIAKNGFCML